MVAANSDELRNQAPMARILTIGSRVFVTFEPTAARRCSAPAHREARSGEPLSMSHHCDKSVPSDEFR